jgi:uncharacterized protein with ParB-like and HNH nuclease domain
MAYEKPICIKEAIQAIQEQEFILPSIQREFVWTTDQIELLFDSLLRDYPISTFLLWKVKGQNVRKFRFYKFLPYYHERDKRHNDTAEIFDDKDRMAVLDGQQRLTSLYIGLKGSYSKKLAKYNWKSNHAFPQKHLYINLLAKSEGSEKEYEFKFLSSDDIVSINNKQPDKFHWFKVGDILEFTSLVDMMNYLVKHSLSDQSQRTEQQINFASTTLGSLYQTFNEKEIINFYLEKSEELDKVLHIFIRVNSGGTKLSYSDLLLSIATAQWKEKDAKEVIHKFVDQINAIGNGFNFHKDLVLKASLVLCDIKDIKFKVDNFTSDNMIKIEEEWESISKSINVAVQLVNHFGFNDKTLTASNALIPIAYFLKKNDIGDQILHSGSQSKNRILIKEWLFRALLKTVFGGTPDNLYPVYRTIISDNMGEFPLHQLIEKYNGTNKSLTFDDATIEHLLDTQYGSSFAFMVLSLLYPLNHNYIFHQDHIYPKKFFTEKSLFAMGIMDSDLKSKYLNSFNSIGNLQLIQETENHEKSAIPFKEWVEGKYDEPGALDNYKNLHLIPKENALTMETFPAFYESRRSLLKEKLLGILNVPKSAPTQTAIVDEPLELDQL